jgi:hypothetical protein
MHFPRAEGDVSMLAAKRLSNCRETALSFPFPG